jgi:WhiB family transcriptional regulator, redox-sensing transcriptional regulator
MSDWTDQAACRGINPDLFYPEHGEAGSTATHAKQVCAGCAVRTECLDYALANAEQYGIWGGLSLRERHTIQARRTGRRAPIVHGTITGYQQHLRRGESACPECRAANALGAALRKERA